MRKTPQISVIIPTYNRANTLTRAIDSVLAQKFNDFELLIVDDGSTDNTPEIVQSYQKQDQRIRYISKENGGVATAWNLGVAESCAPLVALLDSDDEWLPDKLDSQLAYFQTLPDNTPACVTDYRIVDAQGNRIMDVRNSNNNSHTLILRGIGLTQGSTMLIRKEAHQSVGPYDPQLRRAQDWDWLLRFSRHYHMAIMPEILTHYSNTSVTSPLVQLQSLITLHDKHCGVLRATYSKTELAIIKSAVCITLAQHQYRLHHYGHMAYYIAQASYYDPKTSFAAVKRKLLQPLLDHRLPGFRKPSRNTPPPFQSLG